MVWGPIHGFRTDYIFNRTLPKYRKNGASFSAAKQNIQLHLFCSSDFLHRHFSVLSIWIFNGFSRTFMYCYRNFDLRFGFINIELWFSCVIGQHPYRRPRLFQWTVNNSILWAAFFTNSGDPRFVNFARYACVLPFSMSCLKNRSALSAFSGAKTSRHVCGWCPIL